MLAALMPFIVILACVGALFVAFMAWAIWQHRTHRLINRPF